jgi:hypothetical protein
MIVIKNYMTNQITAIIKRLEQQGKAIDTAIAALRDVDASSPASVRDAAQTKRGPAKRRGGMTAEGKERLRAALRKRWAAKKRAAKKADIGDASAGAQTSQAGAPRKRGGISAEGRRKLAEAMKRRWAAKRTAAQAAGGKQAGKAKKSA